MKFCPRCGSDLIEGANFCSYCGYNLSVLLEDDDPIPTYNSEDERGGQPKELEEEPTKELEIPPPFIDKPEVARETIEQNHPYEQVKEVLFTPSIETASDLETEVKESEHSSITEVPLTSIPEPEPFLQPPPFRGTNSTWNSRKEESEITSEAGVPKPPVPEPKQWERNFESSYQQGRTDNLHTQGRSGLIQRVLNILTKPKTEWLVIANENPDKMKLLTGYAMILAIIPALASFISYAFFLDDYSVYNAIVIALLRFVVSLGIIYLATYVSEYLAPSFEAGKDFNRSFQLVCYAYTPGWVFFILALIPHFDFPAIFLGFLYMVYLLHTGIPVIKKTPVDKALGYSILLVLASFFSYLVIYKLLESILL